MIIKKIEYDHKNVQLCGEKPNREKNVFTIIVGRNGCGKSALLRRLCLITLTSALTESESTRPASSFLSYSERNRDTEIDPAGSITFEWEGITNTITIEHPVFNVDPIYFPDHISPEERTNIIERMQRERRYSEPTIRYTSNSNQKKSLYKHPKLIAVSSSPFDKFPTLDEHMRYSQETDANKYYLYRGAKTNSRNPLKDYLTSKFDQLGSSLIDFFLKHKDRKNEILPLFTYLGLAAEFTIILKMTEHVNVEDILNEKGKGPGEVIKSARFFKGKMDINDSELSLENQQRIIKSTRAVYDHFSLDQDSFSSRHFRDQTFKLNLDINSNTETALLADLSTLAEYDLIDLQNIEFKKTKNDNSFLLTDASSGELCTLFNVLSIAGAITDHSVILLDEPELSLHPEWQSDFLPLIEKVFSNYRNCHFIIATHSPQIVSSMSTSNSYVVNLEDNPAKVIDGSQTHLQSSDYQLAYVFKAPGHRNEYLISQIIDTLTRIQEGKELDATFVTEINTLIAFYNLVPNDDPVKKLLSTLKKALRVIENE